jgi:hypothetical protein
VNPNKQKISSEAQWKSLVYEYLTNGNRGKSNFYEHLRTNYKCEKSNTLKKYDVYEVEYDLNLNKGKDDIILETEKERLKSAILTKFERMEIASNIAKGKARKVNDQIIIPTDGDRIRALDYLAKIEGDYAPNKTDINVSSTEINIVGKKFANEDNTE